MEIELKNGKKLNLEVTPLFLEYIEEYEDGLEALKKDAQGAIDEYGYTRKMRAVNHILYSIIASNYNELLTYRQAVRLVKLEDIEKILKYINNNTSLNISFEKKYNELDFKHRM